MRGPWGESSTCRTGVLGMQECSGADRHREPSPLCRTRRPERSRRKLPCSATKTRRPGRMPPPAEAPRVAQIDLRVFGHSAVTDDLEVPKNRGEEQMNAAIPITYVPARNTIFLSFALAWAEVLESSDIVIGVNALDYSGYPDCRPEFIA